MATPSAPISGAGASATDSLYSSGGSDLDILNGLADIPDAPAPPPVADSGAGADAAAPAKTDDAAPAWLETAPEELKSMLGQANLSAAHKAWLKQNYEELNAFKGTPFGSREVTQEMVEMFPGGIEDIRSAHENAQKFTREMEQYASADPTQQGELLGSMLQENPDAFVAMTGVGLDLLKQTLRDDYVAIAQKLTHEHLESVTDGKFGSFFDSISKMASDYSQLAESNPEAAAKLASKLAGSALTLAEWWGDKKAKLGFDPNAPAAVPGARTPVAGRQTQNADQEREVTYALRDATYFEQKLATDHDTAINPQITSALAKELTAREMTLPDGWQKRITNAVASGIINNLKADRGFQATMTRLYHRGDPKNPLRWDKSDGVRRTLIQAAAQRAAKIIPNLLKAALDEIGQIAPGKKAPAAAAAAVRSGARTATGGDPAFSDDDLKNPNIPDHVFLDRMAGIQRT